MKQQEMIKSIARRIDSEGGRALLVGGCVRDEVLGLPCYDIDCEVHGLAPEQLRALLEEFGEIDASGERFGIFTIKGEGIDFALPRREEKTGTGHKDFVVSVDPDLSLEASAARRDFTVNAIMRDALTGEYVDPYGGMEDLRNGILRAVPGGQFEEDPLRVLRGAQFAARFNLVPDEETIESMRRMPLDSLSGARIYAEMKKALLMAEHPDIFFRVLEQADALGFWFSELAALRKTPQNPLYHPEGDAFEHTMLVLNAAAEIRDHMRDPMVFMLAVLTHDLGKAVSTKLSDKGAWQAIGHEHTGIPLCESMLSRLGAAKADIAYAKNMCALHMRLHVCYYNKARISRTNLLFDESICPEELAWLVVCDARGTDKPREAADLEEAFIMERLKAYKEAAARQMPDARMLMALGVEAGPKLKQALALAREHVLCGKERNMLQKKLQENIAYKESTDADVSVLFHIQFDKNILSFHLFAPALEGLHCPEGSFVFKGLSISIPGILL